MRKLKTLMLLCLALLAFQAHADCRLTTPIPLKGTRILVDPQSTTGVVTLRDLVFDVQPTTETVYIDDEHGVGKPLVISLFALRIGDNVSEYLGAKIHPVPEQNGYMGGAGTDLFYMLPNFVQATVKKTGDVTNYETNGLNRDNDKPGTPDPVTRLRAEVSHDLLQSLELTVPVDKVIRKGSYVYAEYQGKNETVCLKSARLFVDGKPVN